MDIRHELGVALGFARVAHKKYARKRMQYIKHRSTNGHTWSSEYLAQFYECEYNIACKQIYLAKKISNIKKKIALYNAKF
jgi:hypothetical protein